MFQGGGVLLLAVMLAACSRDGADGVVDDAVQVNEPDNFATYINQLAELPSGDYEIEVNADTPGEAGSFTVTVTYDDGSTETFEGNWTALFGTRKFEITVYTAGGINIQLASTLENNIRLLNSNGFVQAVSRKVGSGKSKIVLQKSLIDYKAYGRAYYAAIDPENNKDTLEKWKTANGYYEALAQGRVVEPRFRDTKDLGYGRGMYMWSKPDGSLYFFVENFQIRTLPGEAYTSLNLEALLLDIRKHHFGTNAIEFSTYPYGTGEPLDTGSTHKFAKFYTFDASSGSQVIEDHANEIRLDQVNLDGRGDRAMPGACVYCHGGTLRPLRDDGSFRDNTLNGTAGNGIDGDVNAKLQLLEVPSFEYGDYSPYTKAEQEPIIKQVNMAIYCTYPNLPKEGILAACKQYCIDESNTDDCDGNGNSLEAIITCLEPTNTADCDGTGRNLATVLAAIDTAIATGGPYGTNSLTPAGNTLAGQWDGAFAARTTEGWYNDTSSSGMFDRETFNANYVPAEWKHDSSDNMPPAGSEQLYLEVVQPVCFVCHSRRGTSLGSDKTANGKDIDFSSYERFISHAEQIKQYVYDRGVMPLSLRGYNKFWHEDDGLPEILANHLNGILDEDKKISFNNAGKVNEPGYAIADAGPNRTSTSPVRLFGSNSRFVDSYSWVISNQPVGSDAVLTDADTPRPLLTASVDGVYEITLTAAYQSNSTTDTVRIMIDNTLTSTTLPKDPKTITFTDIKTIFSTVDLNDSLACNQCHSGAHASKEDGVPVFWVEDSEQPSTGTTFYQEVLSRVDFNDPENSLLLIKPGGNHHFGGLRAGFEVDNPANRDNYDLVLNWILEGAPEL